MVPHPHRPAPCFTPSQTITTSQFLIDTFATTCNARRRRSTQISRWSLARTCAARAQTTQPPPPRDDLGAPPSTNVDVAVDAGLQFDAKQSKLREGILSIAVGKLGEKPVPPAILPAIAAELRLAEDALQPSFDLLLLRASFLGALFMKQSLNDAEYALLSSVTQLPRTRASATGRHRLPNHHEHGDAEQNGAHSVNIGGQSLSVANAVTAGEVVATIMPKDTQSPLARYAFRLLCDERLDVEEACTLGKLLYADEVMTPIKALIAHVMRVRHETAEELSGLAQAVYDTTKRLLPVRTSAEVSGRPYVLLSEPFDGAITWDMLTPLAARHLQMKHGLCAVVSTGVSSGPKYGPNLHALVEMLAQHVGSARALDFGTPADQAVVHSGLARWVYMRRVIVKRPAIATVEKYADACPVAARLFIASAFHPGYVAKMGEAAEAVGFPAYVIIGKGMEGCIGLGVGRRVANVLVGWQEAHTDGGIRYARETFQYSYSSAGDSGSEDVTRPEKGQADATVTAKRIARYANDGTSGDATFDVRVSATLDALDKCIAIINERSGDILRR